jgi:DNA-binding transcriptional LysR family regulator
MDTRFLEAFVVVAESGSIAEAARQLGIPRATVTQRLRAVESDVGSRLIVRSGRCVKTTVAGARIVDRARHMLQEVQDLRSAASETGLPSGPLRLGVTPTAMTGIVPNVLKLWVGKHPRIEIYIEPGSSTALYGNVLSGKLDAALLVHPMISLPKTCSWVDLRKEPLVLLAHESLKVESPLATLAQESLIRYDRGVVGGKMADAYLRENGITPRVRFELDGIEYIATLVAENLGVSLLPDWATPGPLNPALRKWPLPGKVPVRTMGVLWQHSAVRAPLVEAFVQLCSPVRHFGPPQFHMGSP